jgi:hypothetical protein
MRAASAMPLALAPSFMLAASCLLAAFLLLASLDGHAVDTPTWPPPDPVLARMHALQRVIIDPQSTGAERQAARDELAGLLRSPAGEAKAPTPEEEARHPARAAILPFPSVVKPLPPEKPVVVPPSEVAHVEVLQPPKPVAIPGKGTAIVPTAPAPGFAVDPTNGHVLHGVNGGYVDPRTGQFVPR